MRRTVLGMVLALSAALTGHSQSLEATRPAVLTFEVDFPGQVPPHFTLTIAEDGSGAYTVPSAEALPVVETFRLSPASVAPWFADARALHFFAGKYQSSRKVAFTGTKTLRYKGSDGAGEATLNFTQDSRLNNLLTSLQQLVTTLQAGDRIQSDLRFRRLALDADLQALQAAVKDHMASHPEAIAPVLQSVADSPDVLDRVARSAKSLLQAAH